MVEERLFAVFIDGENISHKHLPAIISEVESQGTVAFRRVYADWTDPAQKRWERPLREMGARPFQQFHYDKDSTDNSIIMDAMETILTTPRINAVCIVGSDHIYHSIAMRVREHGLYMLGIGNRETPRSFVDACNNFVYFDNLQEPQTKSPEDSAKSTPEAEAVEDFLLRAVQRSGGEKIPLSTVGYHLKQMDPGFDPRTYGHERLLPLFESFDNLFQIDTDSHDPPVHFVTIRSPYQKKEVSGTIAKWSPGANYGFIETPKGTYYFHSSNLADPRVKSALKKGKTVTFSEFKKPDPDGTTTEEKNGKASNVTLNSPELSET